MIRYLKISQYIYLTVFNNIFMGIEHDWIHEFFVEKGELFLRVLNKMWENGRTEAEHISNLLNNLGIDKDASILEIGCGNGRILINLALLGYRKLVGIDISPIFIEDAKNKMSKYNVEGIRFIACDILDLEKIFKANEFDVILSVWTSIIGYYLNEEIDIEIFRKLRRIIKDNGYLLILNTANRDYILKIREYCGGPYYVDYGEFVVIEEPHFDPKTSINRSKWIFYDKMSNKDLKYNDEVEVKLRIYSLHEVVKLAEEGGWRFIKAYSNLSRMDEFWPTKGGLNIVFQAV